VGERQKFGGVFVWRMAEGVEQIAGAWTGAMYTPLSQTKDGMVVRTSQGFLR